MPLPGAMLDNMAGKVYRLGDKGRRGHKVKIINQLLAGVHIPVAAEAMAWACAKAWKPAPCMK